MFDELRSDARHLIKTYAKHLPDGAVFTQAQAQATSSGDRVISFWRVPNSDVWGTVQEKRRGNLCGQVIVSTWTPGSETPAFAVVRAADEVPA